MSEVLINAEQLTNASVRLRNTLSEFTQGVDKFDNTAAALMQFTTEALDRFENLIMRLEYLQKTGGANEQIR